MQTQLARMLVNASQHTPFHGRGGYSDSELIQRGVASRFPQADTEVGRFEDFFGFFGKYDVKAALAEMDVLDFGSGYGGRTVEYARLGARHVLGIEPFESMIHRSAAYATWRGIENVSFAVCTQTSIPLEDESVDVVVSYDVLEHVDDPVCSMREIHRVLRRGGYAFLVFPVYFGALSHHLDYISMVPGLHWIFPARTLIGAVNSLLQEHPSIGVATQPAPHRSFDGTRDVLPNLNGLGGEHLRELFRDFMVLQLHRHGLLKRRRPRSPSMRLASSILPTRLQDMITSSVSCVLRK